MLAILSLLAKVIGWAVLVVGGAYLVVYAVLCLLVGLAFSSVRR